MGTRFSIYLPDKLLEWINKQAEQQKRSRNNFIEKILSDVKEGRLIPAESRILEEAEIRKTRLPPSART